MVDARKDWIRGAFLRGAGAVLLAACWLLMRWLSHSATLRQHHDPSSGEFAAAALGFLCFSAGGVLVVLGGHIFDRVEVSERWARRS